VSGSGLGRRLRAAARGLVADPGPDPEPDPEQDPEQERQVDAQLEQTHLGEVFDRGVLRARRRLKAAGGADYDAVRDHLDPVHYLLQAPELLDRPRVDLVEHYLS
jgi:hypothetical protein